MIVNLERFVAEERPQWQQLDTILKQLASDPWRHLTLEEALTLERLYQRASADLARIATFTAEPETRQYLENLVARAYAEIHGGRSETSRFRPWHWLSQILPCAFRRRWRAFAFASALLAAGAIFGGTAVAFDPGAKEVIMPFEHLRDTPSKRVAKEEQRGPGHLEGRKARFSGMLMTHNTQVTLTAMALGMSWGIGTLVVILYNGIILGAVVIDYVADGQFVFLLGWLLPHGAVEIPAMLVGGQAGFVLAGALVARGQRERLAARLREVLPDVVTLCFCAMLMLVWAGVVEAFLSQHHEPVIPYAAKIAFGTMELAGLSWFFARAGHRTKATQRVKK